MGAYELIKSEENVIEYPVRVVVSIDDGCVEQSEKLISTTRFNNGEIPNRIASSAAAAPAGLSGVASKRRLVSLDVFRGIAVAVRSPKTSHSYALYSNQSSHFRRTCKISSNSFFLSTRCPDFRPEWLPALPSSVFRLLFWWAHRSVAVQSLAAETNPMQRNVRDRSQLQITIPSTLFRIRLSVFTCHVDAKESPFSRLLYLIELE
ncbi:hypothetical protein ACLOJK_009439 [Asimina triloba]